MKKMRPKDISAADQNRSDKCSRKKASGLGFATLAGDGEDVLSVMEVSETT